MGARAAEYVLREHSPARYAQAVLGVLRRSGAVEPRTWLVDGLAQAMARTGLDPQQPIGDSVVRTTMALFGGVPRRPDVLRDDAAS
jgi:hypothetical protein